MQVRCLPPALNKGAIMSKQLKKEINHIKGLGESLIALAEEIKDKKSITNKCIKYRK